ncbi:protein of unknown function [uncultured Sphingopyxis sp.]|uniref:Uncharacterized protein n=1 Tax=uncultured Sphingopyxis sp. TaxID=310581 RepID=A0A1Y5PWY9_9SPHN|nr:protein of unknown function [uncultured Sphingopyxis sp.]
MLQLVTGLSFVVNCAVRFRPPPESNMSAFSTLRHHKEGGAAGNQFGVGLFQPNEPSRSIGGQIGGIACFASSTAFAGWPASR